MTTTKQISLRGSLARANPHQKWSIPTPPSEPSMPHKNTYPKSLVSVDWATTSYVFVIGKTRASTSHPFQYVHPNPLASIQHPIL